MSNSLVVYGSFGAPKNVAGLCKAYDSVADLYGIGARASTQGSGASPIDYLRMPLHESARYESRIRRAMLDPCQTLEDFDASIYGDHTGSATEKRMREGLRDAFTRRTAMPYDRAASSRSVYYKEGLIESSLAKPFHISSLANNMLPLIFRYTRTGQANADKTLAISEFVPGALNLCFTHTPENNMRKYLPVVTSRFRRYLLRHPLRHPGVPSLEGRRITIYLHTPVECSGSGKDEFHLVVIPRKGLKFGLMPLYELPRAIDRIFHDNHKALTDCVAVNPVYDDFRSFALRAM